MYQKTPECRSEKLRRWANTQPCETRIPGHCTGRDCVWAHVPSGFGKGVGYKPPDLLGTVACSDCHDVIDGRNTSHKWDHVMVMHFFWEGHGRSIISAFQDGIIKFG